MSVTIKPSGLSTTALVANQVSLTASYLESFKRPRCCKTTYPLQTSVTYSTGTTTFNGTSVFVSVIATISVVYVQKNGNTKTRVFTEVFDIAFQGQTEAPTSVTISSLGRTSTTYNDCCGLTNLGIDDSITILIA